MGHRAVFIDVNLLFVSAEAKMAPPMQGNPELGRTSEAVNLGYDESTRGYHVYLVDLKSFTIGGGVKFADHEFTSALKRSVTHTPRSPKPRQLTITPATPTQQYDPTMPTVPAIPMLANAMNWCLHFSCPQWAMPASHDIDPSIPTC